MHEDVGQFPLAIQKRTDFPFDEQQISAMSIVWSSLQVSYSQGVYVRTHVCIYIYIYS